MPNTIVIKQLRAAALRDQNYTCFYCEEPLSPSAATADHLTPTSLKGVNACNIVAACEDCNSAKSDMSSEDFLFHMTSMRIPKSWGLFKAWRKHNNYEIHLEKHEFKTLYCR